MEEGLEDGLPMVQLGRVMLGWDLGVNKNQSHYLVQTLMRAISHGFNPLPIFGILTVYLKYWCNIGSLSIIDKEIKKI